MPQLRAHVDSVHLERISHLGFPQQHNRPFISEDQPFIDLLVWLKAQSGKSACYLQSVGDQLLLLLLFLFDFF